ncbi:MAG: hypothetical protein GF364_16520 [Candidatus Lokiarchaeota archaeon]|nr:hypothetical protein [Candidatus Lokiarchaeota archaeon]
MYNQMFKKYLLKKDFWQTKSADGTWFIKHDPIYGGIYARLFQKGVEIQYNNERKVFTNFNELDAYLDRISVRDEYDDNQKFLNLINRRMTSKWLRSSLPL